MNTSRRFVDFEFTLALNNATGKYFVCYDVIEECAGLIEKVWYWRLPLQQPPARSLARIWAALLFSN